LRTTGIEGERDRAIRKTSTTARITGLVRRSAAYSRKTSIGALARRGFRRFADDSDQNVDIDARGPVVSTFWS
jgi:hypothetical protein